MSDSVDSTDRLKGSRTGNTAVNADALVDHHSMCAVRKALVGVSLPVRSTNRFEEQRANASFAFPLMCYFGVGTGSETFIGVSVAIRPANRLVEFIADAVLTFAFIRNGSVITGSET